MSVTLKSQKGELVVVDKDEHPRQTSLDTLAKLKGVVSPNGSVTAGNASGVNDGACAVLMADEQNAGRFGLTPRARIVGMTAAGVPPRVTQCCVQNRATTMLQKSLARFHGLGFCVVAPRPGLEPGTYGLTEIQARKKPL